RDGVEVVRGRAGADGGEGGGAAAFLRDAPRGARGDLESVEPDLVGMGVAAARPGEHAHADALVDGARRLLDDALFQRRGLRGAMLEVEVRVVCAASDRRFENALEPTGRELESIEEETFRTLGGHARTLADGSRERYHHAVGWDAVERLVAEMIAQ